MVYNKLRINSEYFEESLLVPLRVTCDISHCKKPLLRQFVCNTLTYPPKIGYRLMSPKLSAVALLIKLGNANAVLVGRHFFCHYVHCYFRKIHICAYPCGRCNARFGKHRSYHLHHKFVSRAFI